MSARETGQTFLEQLLAHVPEDKRDAAREALGGSEALLTELGAATIRQSDYSRNMNDVAAYKQQLDAWFAENQAALTEAARLKAEHVAAPTPAAPIQSPAAGLTREDLAKELEAVQRAGVAAIVHTTELASRHMKTFNEVLNIQALMADPDINKLGLLGVYDKHYKPKLDELASQAEQARIEAEVQKRLADERKRFTQMPYPVNGREPSPLDALEAAVANPPDPTKPVQAPVASHAVVDEAVAQYNAAMARALGQPTI